MDTTELIEERRNAVIYTIEMWTWLAEHPNANKQDYPKYTAFCAACDYAENFDDFTCGRCAIEAWREGDMCNESPSGPYLIWSLSASTTARIKAANKIVELAKESLAQLDKGEIGA